MPVKMPILFVGHGSPMNAIEDNSYTRVLRKLGQTLPQPRAVLCISAHWMTEGTWITGQAKPKTIHDFYGFPEALTKVQYPAPGSPDAAVIVQNSISLTSAQIDNELWGFDHGTWSVLRHIYPNADVPVLQLSLNIAQPPEYHFQLGREIQKLRTQGVLIVGSGNIVHNLRQIRWQPNSQPFDWAINFDAWVKSQMEAQSITALVKAYNNAPEGKLSVPTPEHYYPFLYILGAADKTDRLKFEYEEIQNGSIGMRTFTYS